MNDEQIIRKALEQLTDRSRLFFEREMGKKALAALDRVMERTLPELPEYPWLCLEWTSSGYVAYFDYGGADDGNVLKSKPAIGATIPAAIQAAIEKIGDAK